ncbi:MAG: hypothetical protein AAF432_10170 [Planctomycetota bacterium]
MSLRSLHVWPVAIISLAIGHASADHVDWRANTLTRSTQAEGTIAVMPDNDMVIAWSSRRQHMGRTGVFAQRFYADGTALGSETQLSVWPHGHQTAPALAGTEDGSFWAAWQSHGQDGDDGAILLRRFSATFDGGDEILVNDITDGRQERPALHATPDGGVIVAWTDWSGEMQQPRARLRAFDRHGTPHGPSIPMTSRQGGTSQPSFAIDQDGTVFAAYTEHDDKNRPIAIAMQRLTSTLRPVGERVLVTSTDAIGPIESAIAVHDGAIAVTWLQIDRARMHYAAWTRTGSTEHGFMGASLPVDQTAMQPHQGLDITAAPDGAFIVAWTAGQPGERDVLAHRLHGDGTLRGEPFHVHAKVDGDQGLNMNTAASRIVATATGRLVSVWQGDADAHDGSGIGVSVLDTAPGALASSPGLPLDAVAADLYVRNTSRTASPHEPPSFDPETVVDNSNRIVALGGTSPGFDGILNTGWNPPDPTMAVGPNHVVAMTNGGIAFLTKTGTQTFFDEIDGGFGFWGALGATGFVFDPEALYDPMSERFFVMASEDAPNNESYILIAVSDDDDPNGAWNRYRVDTTSLAGNTYDSPNMAVDQDVLYITGDAVDGVNAYPIFTFLKSDLIDGLPLSPVQSTTLPTNTLSAGHPDVMPAAAPALYLIEHREGANRTSVRLIALTNPLTGITLTEVSLPVPAYSSPIDFSHLGTSSIIETFDARFWSVDYANGSLWACHHIGSSGRTLSRWYEIDMNGWPLSGQSPTLVQSGTIDPGPGVFATFCSIGADDNGNVAVCYARSSADSFFSMATVSRSDGDPAGSMGEEQIWQTNNATFNGNRWGDYSRVQADPSDGTFWANHEYAVSGSWRTWVQNISPPPPSNNGCAGSTLVFAGDTAISTENANSSGFSEACGSFENDVWFRYIATEPGELTVSVCDADFDTQIAIYSFTCPADQNLALECNDDACGTGSSVTLTVANPTLFRIRVGSANGTTGSGTLVIDLDTGNDIVCIEDCAPDNGDGTFGNGTINIDDLLAVINAFGQTDSRCDIAPDNGDGTFGNDIVNIDDLLAVINAFGPCPS